MLRICLKLILYVCGFIVYLSMLLTNPRRVHFGKCQQRTFSGANFDPLPQTTKKIRDGKTFYIIYIFCRNRDGMPL